MTPIQNAYTHYLKPALKKHPVLSITAGVVATAALCYVAITWMRSRAESPTKPDDNKPNDPPVDAAPRQRFGLLEHRLRTIDPALLSTTRRQQRQMTLYLNGPKDVPAPQFDVEYPIPLRDRLTIQYSRWLPAPFARNVMFVGSTRTGKSCAARTLENPYYIPPGMNMFSATRHPGMLHSNLGRCTVHILDTPGLNDVVTIGKDGTRLSNPQIIEMVHEAVHQAFGNYGNVSRVFMTMTAGHLNAGQLSAFEAFFSALPDGVNKTLLLTHADATDLEERADIIQQLKDNPQVGRIIAKHFHQGDEILFFGAQNKSYWTGMHVVSIQTKTQTIQNPKNIWFTSGLTPARTAKASTRATFGQARASLRQWNWSERRPARRFWRWIPRSATFSP